MVHKPGFPPFAEREHAIIIPEIARIEAASQEQDQIGGVHADRGGEGERRSARQPRSRILPSHHRGGGSRPLRSRRPSVAVPGAPPWPVA